MEVVEVALSEVPLTLNYSEKLIIKEHEELVSPSETDVYREVPEVALSTESLPFPVPPATPSTRFSFLHPVESVKISFPKLDNLHLPYIREVGIKTSIEILSEFFSLPDYKYNPVQFWFLDVITDCLWKTQDEFHFPDRYQKIILQWILYVIDLIRDPQKNLSRKEFFRVFNEAVVVANETIQSGCEILPPPGDLFALIEGEDEETTLSSGSDPSISSYSVASSAESYLAVGIDENTEIFKLPKAPPKCYKFDPSVDDDDDGFSETESECGCEDSVDFYQPDSKTPDRFKSSTSSSSSFCEIAEELPPLKEEKILWKKSSLVSNKLQKICSNDEIEPPLRTSMIAEPANPLAEEWENYLGDRTELVQDLETNIMINSCALFAIKQFVHDYFHETFQFTVVKLALINNFTSITQRINTDWSIPKVLKQELKKPKVKKEKKKKKAKKKEKKKQKKPKKKTPRKKTKKTKKKKKPKGSKKTKKKKKLTKEEKAELARLKREQQLLDEELRKAEENRRLLFPLNEAADEDFFRSIFENWVKPKQKQEKGGKKGKKKKK